MVIKGGNWIFDLDHIGIWIEESNNKHSWRSPKETNYEEVESFKEWVSTQSMNCFLKLSIWFFLCSMRQDTECTDTFSTPKMVKIIVFLGLSIVLLGFWRLLLRRYYILVTALNTSIRFSHPIFKNLILFCWQSFRGYEQISVWLFSCKDIRVFRRF